jgi:hypothetical protein
MDDHPYWSLARVRRFVGYLSVAIPELHPVEMGRLAEALDTFAARDDEPPPGRDPAPADRD